MASIPHTSWSRLSPFPPPPCDTGVSIKAQLFFVCVLHPPSVHIDKRSSLHIWTIVGSAKLMESCTYLWPALSGCTYSICAVLCFIGFCASPKNFFLGVRYFTALFFQTVWCIQLICCAALSLTQGSSPYCKVRVPPMKNTLVCCHIRRSISASFFHYCQNSPKLDIPASLFLFFF